jgi:hypothetical protein
MQYTHTYSLFEDETTQTLRWANSEKKGKWRQILYRNYPSLRVLLVTWAMFAMWYLYGSVHWHRDPESFFYDAKRAYIRKYSLEREKEASDSLAKTLGDQNWVREQTPWKKSKKPEVCAVISSHGSMRENKRHPLEVRFLKERQWQKR